jgi:hypothetical protein
MSNKLYDLSILSEMVYGDTEFMKELVDTFIEYAPMDTLELRDYAKSENWEETSKKAHKLKSSIRTIGVTSLADLILEIEVDSKQHVKTHLINEKISQFSNTLEMVIEQLKIEKF